MSNINQMTPSVNQGKMLPLKELAPHTPYAVGYLSLMARRGNLKVKKVNGTWYSMMENVKEFEELMNKRKEERKRALSHRYQTKVAVKRKELVKKETGLKIKVKGDTIFDEVQNDLKAVLHEIREKEREIKKEYREYRRKAKSKGGRMTPVPFSTGQAQREKEKGEDIAEKLILDLGKLINTANQVSAGVEEIEDKKSGNDLVSIPIITGARPIPQNKLYEAIEKKTKPTEKDSDLSIYPNFPNPLPFEDEYRGNEGRRQKIILNVILLALFATIIFFLFLFIAFG